MAIERVTKFLPQMGLAINPTGGAIQNVACIDSIMRQLSSGTAGTIANAETVIAESSAEVPSGILDISMCSNIGVYISALKGSLTSYDLIPEFGMGDFIDSSNPLWAKRGWPSIAAGVVTVTPLTYRFTADYTGWLSLNNPGARYLRFKTASVGTVTSSLIVLYVTRGCAGMGNILAG